MLLIKNARQVVSPHPSEVPLSGERLGDLNILSKTDIAIEDETIVEIGHNLDYPDAIILDASDMVVVPGFVDPHTHMVFAGSREHELMWKLEGKSYQDILAEGGGIMRTVNETRAASEDELKEQSLKRFRQAVKHGTTTIEIKSGYGLDLDTEIRQLQVAKWLGEQGLAEVVSTFMGAHAFPSDVSREQYISLIIDEVLPAVKDLAEFCDVFCEKGAFSVEESRVILEAAKNFGLQPRIHADEFDNIGAGDLAAEVKAISADHLVVSTKETFRTLKNAGCIGILLPGTPLSTLSDEFANARKMVASNLPIALATDCNPNCYTESMQFIQQLAVFRMGLTPAEALTASTLNAALALGRKDRGCISEGKRADLLIMNIPDYQHIVYHFGINHVKNIIIGGKLID
ncbi:MAG: imidazolonepropionase [Marine Group III euryarchaeote CG-Bathy1]|uniref:Imidazolonepropionase n=1 Tax=Marine Group III euryarchaeote CG-Bathy1 TaxID=1889001 RepID=A0A1J5TD17_9ARCH|nr:MAG: imidazolonepropionase [Marine Group III euryarchaeote CG-Bathy1]